MIRGLRHSLRANVVINRKRTIDAWHYVDDAARNLHGIRCVSEKEERRFSRLRFRTGRVETA